MKIREVMCSDVHLTSPGATLRDAAGRMAEIDAGSLPVGEGDRLIGMVTDRDIAVRGVARGLPPESKVQDVMTGEVKYCFDDEDVEHVARNMANIQVRRLPVVNRDKRLVGIVSIGDIAAACGPHPAGVALSGIAQPSTQHSQSAPAGNLRRGSA